MCNLLPLIAHAPLREASLRWLHPLATVQAADPRAFVANLDAGVTVSAACVFAALCCVWAVRERARAGAFRRSHQKQRARFRIAKRVRDAVIANGKESVQLYGAGLSKALNFGDAASQIDACAAGPDGTAFLVARKQLLEAGTPFDMEVRTNTNNLISVRGRPIAGYAALFLQQQSKGDAGAALVEMPATEAYGEMIDDSCDTRDDGSADPVELDAPRPTDKFDTVLERLTDAIAVFGADRELIFYNRACVDLWGLPAAWLDTSPTLSQILDRLREAAWLPEQSDFAAWKAHKFAAFQQPNHCSEEQWHLPSGKSLRVLWQVNPARGVTAVFQNITDRLALESSRKTHVKMLQAVVEIFPESAAIFGVNGRLRKNNSAFRRLFELSEADVCSKPHMADLAALANASAGSDAVWELVSAAVSSPSLETQNTPVDVALSDGRILAITLARLPDGSTFAGFNDVTDLRQLELALRERAA